MFYGWTGARKVRPYSGWAAYNTSVISYPLSHSEDRLIIARVVFDGLLHERIVSDESCISSEVAVAALEMGDHLCTLVVEDEPGRSQTLDFIDLRHDLKNKL